MSNRMKPLKRHLIETYGSIYRAARELGRTETQLRNWCNKGAHVDDEGVVWAECGRLQEKENDRI